MGKQPPAVRPQLDHLSAPPTVVHTPPPHPRSRPHTQAGSVQALGTDLSRRLDGICGGLRASIFPVRPRPDLFLNCGHASFTVRLLFKPHESRELLHPTRVSPGHWAQHLGGASVDFAGGGTTSVPSKAVGGIARCWENGLPRSWKRPRPGSHLL